MQDGRDHIDIEALVHRYLSSNASDEEVRELEAWVELSPENRAAFIEAKKTWELSAIQSNQKQVDVQSAYDEIAGQLFDSAPVVEIRSRSRRKWMAVAASFLILAVSFLVFQNQGQQFATTNSALDLNLDDGSQVILNHESTIQVVMDDEKQRRIVLDGDAYFDVARDENRPFVIQADDIEVAVLGTSFYVDARSEEGQIQVVVESGKVAVEARGNQVILTKGESATFDKRSHTLRKAQNQDANFNAIKTKKLVFENNTLEEVAYVLNRQFNKEVVFKNDALKDCLLTTTFHKKSSSAILKIIESTLGIKAVEQDGVLVFDGQCR